MKLVMPGIGHPCVGGCDHFKTEKIHEKESGIDQDQGAAFHISNLQKPGLNSGNCLRNRFFYLRVCDVFLLADKSTVFADRILLVVESVEFLGSKKYVMIRSVFITYLILFSLAVSGQQVDWKKIKAADPDKVLLDGTRQPVPVLLLGSFHFGYPNLDGHKTDSSKYIDVKSPVRQKELKELAEVIMRFKPTRIYVESSDAGWIDSLYEAYRKGSYSLGRNEIFQVGFRVAGLAGISKIYSVDTWPFSYEYEKKYPWIDSLWSHNTPVDSVRDKYWASQYSRWYNAGDSIELQMTMLENFLTMAEPGTLQRMHGHYMSSWFSTAEEPTGSGQQGPDALSIWWYNRNLRIFNNILRTKPGPEDRIVVLFGNGHMPILKHCFYSSPEFRVVELKSLLKNK
jgi:hypothetical protein